MPVYNSASYLAESIGSILSSTFKDLEIILVDDGSTDESGVICDTFAVEDRHIRVIHQPNAGASRARNKGLEVAVGTFVAFVDSDDQVTPRMYEKLVSAAEPGFDIAFCDMLLHYNDCDVAQETFKLGSDRIRTLRNLLLSGIGGGPCHMIVRRSISIVGRISGLHFDYSPLPAQLPRSKNRFISTTKKTTAPLPIHQTSSTRGLSYKGWKRIAFIWSSPDCSIKSDLRFIGPFSDTNPGLRWIRTDSASTERLSLRLTDTPPPVLFSVSGSRSS